MAWHAFSLQDGERGQIAGEQRQLDDVGAFQRLGVPAGFDQIPADDVGRLLEDRASGRVFEPGIGHARILRTLAREEDANSDHRAAPRGMQMFAARPNPGVQRDSRPMMLVDPIASRVVTHPSQRPFVLQNEAVNMVATACQTRA